jgi:hypothetical protein
MFATTTVQAQAQAQAECEQEKLRLGDRVRLKGPIHIGHMQLDAGTMATVMMIVTKDIITVKIDRGVKFESTADMWKQAM